MSNQQTQKKRTGLFCYQLKQIRARILFEQDFGCGDCGTPIGKKRGDAHLHHINENPRDNHIDNLIVLCQVCHWCVHDFQDSKERGLVPKNNSKKQKKR